MIKKIFRGLIFWALIFVTGEATAADLKLSWDHGVGADLYLIQMSLDGGETWTENRTVPGNQTSMVWTDVPDDRLIHFRAGSVWIQKGAGAWYNGAWRNHPDLHGIRVEE